MCPEMPAPVIAAQVQTESAWDPRAVSPVGAQGIAQFMPATWAAAGRDWSGNGVTDVWDPADAIPSQGGFDCSILAQLRPALAAGRVHGDRVQRRRWGGPALWRGAPVPGDPGLRHPDPPAGTDLRGPGGAAERARAARGTGRVLRRRGDRRRHRPARAALRVGRRRPGRAQRGTAGRGSTAPGWSGTPSTRPAAAGSPSRGPRTPRPVLGAWSRRAADRASTSPAWRRGT